MEDNEEGWFSVLKEVSSSIISSFTYDGSADV